MTSQRIHGWRGNLKKMVLENGARPFEWGVNDCMTLAAEAIRIMTGLDVMAKWPEYHNKHEAIEAVNQKYGLGFLETFTRIFEDAGFEPTPFFALGNVGFIKTENMDQEAAELFDGVTLATGLSDTGHVFAPGRSGLVLIHRYERVKIWRL